MRKIKLRLRVGRKYRLINDIGVLPKGVYRLEELAEFSASFSVGEDRLIHFTMIDISKKHIRTFFQIEKDHVESTDPDDFAHRYFSRVMMTKNSTKPMESARSQPITLVAIDQSIESRYRDIAQEVFGPDAYSGAQANNVLQ